MIKIYTDGGSRNTGVKVKGGHVAPTDLSAWAFAIEKDGKIIYQQSGFKLGETNNRMELVAAGSALRYISRSEELKNEKIVLISDSAYVLNPLEKGWLDNWIAKNDSKRLNFDLWKVFFPLWQQFKGQTTLQWVRGHQNTEGNLLVDSLLNEEMDSH